MKRLFLITAIFEWVASIILLIVGTMSFMSASDNFMRWHFIGLGITCIAIAIMWTYIGFQNLKFYKEAK